MRKKMTDLPSAVGVNQDDGSRRSDGREGLLSYGPYCSLPPGPYFAGFHVEAVSPLAEHEAVKVDVCANSGGTLLSERHFAGDQILSGIAGLVGTSFDLLDPAAAVEVRLYVPASVQVAARSMVLFRREPLER